MATQLGSAYGAIKIDASGALSSISAVKGGLLGLGGPMGGAGAAAAGFGVAIAGVGLAAAGAGAALGGVVSASIKTAASFEQAMDRVGALAGITDKADERFAALTAQAEELGATTQFTATEAAEGMQFLAMAGFETSDILAAMPGLLSAASAGQLDLATTSDIVSNVLSGFNIEASQTGRVADILTATFTSANVDMRMLGDSMKYAAPIAAQLGIDIEEVSAAIGVMGNAGIQGSSAGTALRTTLTKLAAPVGDAADLLAELGITLTDQEGVMLPLNEMLSNINTGFADLSDTQRTAAAQTLVGRNAMSGFLVMLQNAADGTLPDLTNELEHSFGTADRIASQQLDNLLGARTILMSAIDGIKIGIGNEFLPLITDSTRNLSAFLTDNKDQIVSFFGGIADAISYMGQEATPWLEYFSDAVTAFQAGGLFGSRSGSFGSTGLLTALGVPPGVQDIIQSTIDTIYSFSDAVAGAVEAYNTGGVTGLFEFVKQQIDTSWPQILATLDGWSEEIWGWVNQAILIGGQKLNEFAQALYQWVSSPEAQVAMTQLGESIGQMLYDALSLNMTNQERAGGVLFNFVSTLAASVPSIIGNLILAGAQIAAGIIAGIIEGISGNEVRVATISELQGLAQYMIDTISGIDWMAIGSDIVAGMIEGIVSKGQELRDTITGVVGSMTSTVTGVLDMHSPSRVFAGIGQNISLGLAQGVRETAGAAAAEIAKVVSPAGLSPAFSGAGGAVDNSRHTENNLSMTVNTNAASSDVIQDFATLRALAA